MTLDIMVSNWKNSSCSDGQGSKITRSTSATTRSVGKPVAYDLAKQAQCSEENIRAYTMLDIVADALLSTDIKSNITYMNRAAETLTGVSRENALGRPLHEIFKVIDVASRQPRRNLALKVMDTGLEIPLHSSALLIAADGSERAIEDSATPLFNENAKVIGAMILFHDSRYSSETTAKMSYMAQHDALTGLLNRYAFSEQFEQAAALARRHRKKMVMLFIDLDNFKQVNDSLGHNSGDAILKALGQKLLTCVRETDQVCRYGGDEFVILLSDIEYPENSGTVFRDCL